MKMPEKEPAPGQEAEPNIADELAAIPHEPLLPIEKRLIVWSLVIGLLSLALLVWISTAFFPVVTEPK
jgi:hypothetical protein